MRYAYAITSALLIGGAAATMTLQQPLGAQTAPQNPPGMQGMAPRAGAPMSFADLTARLQPAVVNISTTQRVPVAQQQNPFAGTPFADLFGQFGGQGQGQGQNGRPITREGQSLGSGFIISPDGYIVTNNHVVAAGTRGAVVEQISVTLPDRKEYVAKLVGRDAASDLALLKIDARNLPYVRFGDSSQTRVGDWVIAIGNPFGLGGTVTAGIVSAVHRSTGQGGAADRYIQTDAAINRGNSGGPMFDLNGNVVGINSSIFSPTGGSVGVGFAIPAETAKPIIDSLRAGKAVQRGYLGVGIQPIDADIAASLGLPRNVGELIRSVEPGEAAERSGIRVGDVVTKVNGQDVTPDNTLSYIVANTTPGTRVPVEIIRDGRRTTLTATVGTRPSEEQLAGFNTEDDSDEMGPMGDDSSAATTSAANALGLQVQPLTPQIARSLGIASTVRGVVVARTDPASDAANKGIGRGTVISSINRQPVATVAEVNAAIAAARSAGRKSVLLYVQVPRAPAGAFVAVDLAS